MAAHSPRTVGMRWAEDERQRLESLRYGSVDVLRDSGLRLLRQTCEMLLFHFEFFLFADSAANHNDVEFPVIVRTA
jgi:hypothetical protein